MAYTLNPHQPKVRRDAVRKVKLEHWSVRQTARYFGVFPSTVSRWVKRDVSGGRYDIPTRSSKPRRSPRALSREVVSAIITKRLGRRRCGQVIHHELLRDGVVVSLSSVQRTLERCHMLVSRSPWKRPHDYTPRPTVTQPGALLEIDTVHIRTPDGGRLYIYTIIDLYSRWVYAEAVPRIGAAVSVAFVRRATARAPFSIRMVQSDHGSEFSTWFTHGCLRLGIMHRHARVRQKDDQAHIERFNRTVQEECLDRTTHTLKEFRRALAEYLPYYNGERLHMGINYQTPLEVLRRC
jgi:transposase InsO family protein